MPLSYPILAAFMAGLRLMKCFYTAGVPVTLAIFDLDETPISSDNVHEWCQFPVNKCLVDPDERLKAAAEENCWQAISLRNQH